MKSAHGSGIVLARLEPEEEVCAGLLHLLTATGAPAGVVTGLVGSLRRVAVRTASCDDQGRPGYGERTERRGALEIVAAQGQLGRTSGGEPQLHLHGAFVDNRQDVVGGHVLEAEVLITVEVAVLVVQDVQWQRTHIHVAESGPFPVLQPS